MTIIKAKQSETMFWCIENKKMYSFNKGICTVENEDLKFLEKYGYVEDSNKKTPSNSTKTKKSEVETKEHEEVEVKKQEHEEVEVKPITPIKTVKPIIKE